MAKSRKLSGGVFHYGLGDESARSRDVEGGDQKRICAVYFDECLP